MARRQEFISVGRSLKLGAMESDQKAASNDRPRPSVEMSDHAH
jgi:hypothetical protein